MQLDPGFSRVNEAIWRPKNGLPHYLAKSPSFTRKVSPQVILPEHLATRELLDRLIVNCPKTRYISGFPNDEILTAGLPGDVEPQNRVPPTALERI
jgi:hypothetical protein